MCVRNRTFRAAGVRLFFRDASLSRDRSFPAPAAVGGARAVGHRLRHRRRFLRRRRARRDRRPHRARRQPDDGDGRRRRIQLPERRRRNLRADGDARRLCDGDAQRRQRRIDRPRRRPADHAVARHAGRDRGRERQPRRHRARRRAGDDERDHQRDAGEHAGAELRRSAARRAGRQRDPDVGARHQPHQPAGDLDAVQLGARARRRTIGLPRFLRSRALGLRADQSRRRQAGRGDPRAGVGGVGRQRADRRRQHHHQVAARAEGRDGGAERRRLQPRCRVRRRQGTGRDLRRERDLRRRAEQYLVVPRVGRLLQLRRLSAADRTDSCDHPSARSDDDRRRCAVSSRRPRRHRHGIREPRHQPAEVRRPRRSGDRRRPDHLRRRRRRQLGHHPHRDRAVRHSAGVLHRLRQGELHQGRAEGERVHQPGER